MLILDTHAFVWLVSDLTKLPDGAKNAIRRHAEQLCISGISALEIGLAVKRGRLELPTDPATFIRQGMRRHGIRELPLSCEIGWRAAMLPDIHNDPFDRILVATALVHRATILSKDAVLPTYPGVTVIWS